MAELAPSPSMTSFAMDGIVYSIGQLLGRGGFAAVHEVSVVSDGRRAAGKFSLASRLNGWARERADEEAQIWAKLSHPHICRFFGTTVLQPPAVESPWLVLLVELARGGELFDRVVQIERMSEVSTVARM